MSPRRTIAIMLFIALAALAAVARAVADRPTPPEPLMGPSLGTDAEPELAAPDPLTREYAPTTDRCPRFVPRTVPKNGSGWRVYADSTLCLNAEYPANWNVHTSPTGVSFTEPTGHEGEWFETAFPGELTGEVHVRFSAAAAWAPEPEEGSMRRNAVIYERPATMHAHVASFRILLSDRTLIDLDAHAPEKDDVRRKTALSILRSVELQDDADVADLAPYVH